MDEEKYTKYETQKQSLFNGKNFNNWKFRIEVLMKEHDVGSFLTKSVDEHEEIIIAEDDTAAVRAEKNNKKQELTKLENKCHSMIIRRISDDYLEYVKDKATPKEVWSTLKANFERQGVANPMFLRRKLLTLKMIEGADLESHLLEFDKTLRDLKSAGAKIEDEDVVCQLLLTLPKSYDPVVTALETMKIDDLTINFVKARLLDNDVKRKADIESEAKVLESTQIAMSGVVKKDVICYSCGKRGHYKSDCKQNTGSRSSRNNRYESLWVHIDNDDDGIAF